MEQDKKQKPTGFDHQLADPPPHPVWPRSKIQCLLGGEKGEVGELGAGAASSWGGEEKEEGAKKEKK